MGLQVQTLKEQTKNISKCCNCAREDQEVDGDEALEGHEDDRYLVQASKLPFSSHYLSPKPLISLISPACLLEECIFENDKEFDK